MNATTLIVIAWIAGVSTQVVTPYPTAEECLAAAEQVVTIEQVVTVECRWVEVEDKLWRTTFGEVI